MYFKRLGDLRCNFYNNRPVVLISGIFSVLLNLVTIKNAGFLRFLRCLVLIVKKNGHWRPFAQIL